MSWRDTPMARALREKAGFPARVSAEDGPTWRALEAAMKRYLDGDPGNRDWMPVQEALWERDRFHAAEARTQARTQDAPTLRTALLGALHEIDPDATDEDVSFRQYADGLVDKTLARLLAAPSE